MPAIAFSRNKDFLRNLQKEAKYLETMIFRMIAKFPRKTSVPAWCGPTSNLIRNLKIVINERVIVQGHYNALTKSGAAVDKIIGPAVRLWKEYLKVEDLDGKEIFNDEEFLTTDGDGNYGETVFDSSGWLAKCFDEESITYTVLDEETARAMSVGHRVTTAEPEKKEEEKTAPGAEETKKEDFEGDDWFDYEDILSDPLADKSEFFDASTFDGWTPADTRAVFKNKKKVYQSIQIYLHFGGGWSAKKVGRVVNSEMITKFLSDNQIKGSVGPDKKKSTLTLGRIASSYPLQLVSQIYKRRMASELTSESKVVELLDDVALTGFTKIFNVEAARIIYYKHAILTGKKRKPSEVIVAIDIFEGIPTAGTEQVDSFKKLLGKFGSNPALLLTHLEALVTGDEGKTVAAMDAKKAEAENPPKAK